jgi:excisionase family DNA binding protein
MKLAAVSLSSRPREDDRRLIAFVEAMTYLDCTKNWLKMAVAKREIESVRIGRQTKFTRAGLDRYIATRMTVPVDKRR